MYVEIPDGFTMGSATSISIQDSAGVAIATIPLDSAQLQSISDRDDAKAYVKNYISLA